MSQIHNDFPQSHIPAEDEYWPRSCLTYEHITRGDKRPSDPIQTAFAPSMGDVIAVTHHSDAKQVASVVSSRKTPGRDLLCSALAIGSAHGKTIHVTLQPSFPIGKAVYFRFMSKRQSPHKDLEEFTEDRESNKLIYASCWAIDDFTSIGNQTGYDVPGESMTLTRDLVDMFVAVIAKGQGHVMFPSHLPSSAPLDLGIVVA